MNPIKIDSISQMPLTQAPKKVDKATADNFKAFLTESLNKVNEAQKTADDLNNKLIKGEIEDVHQVMIAGQKASIALQLTTQVRNKVVEAYQEVMRMQV